MGNYFDTNWGISLILDKSGSYHLQNRELIAGKKAIIVTPMNQKDVDFESEVLVEFYNRLLDCLGVNNNTCVFL
ncbi:MAG: hypothetical protein AB1488_00700 [Nitrospirota bacterium]